LYCRMFSFGLVKDKKNKNFIKKIWILTQNLKSLQTADFYRF